MEDVTRSATPSRNWAATLAVLSLGAAAIHFAVTAEHLAEWWAFGVFFAGLGWFQALWPVAYLTRPTRRLTWLGVAVNLATVALWAWTRTVGLPFGPHQGLPEAVGMPDLAASILELLIASALVIGERSPQREYGGRRRPRTAIAPLLVSALVVAFASIVIAVSEG